MWFWIKSYFHSEGIATAVHAKFCCTVSDHRLYNVRICQAGLTQFGFIISKSKTHSKPLIEILILILTKPVKSIFKSNPIKN